MMLLPKAGVVLCDRVLSEVLAKRGHLSCVLSECVAAPTVYEKRDWNTGGSAGWSILYRMLCTCSALCLDYKLSKIW